MEIQQIKSLLSLLTVLTHYNIQPDKHHQIKCPFHDDDKPSCKIYPDTNTYHCFACGKTGDQIQFIQDKEGITKHEALLRATALINNEKLTIRNENPIAPQVQPQSLAAPNYPELFKSFLQSIERSANAQNYCASRGLDYKTLEIGYNPSTGLRTGSGEKWNKLKQCIIFPLKDKTGNIVSLYGRRISDTSTSSVSGKGYNLEYGRHYYSENRKGLYPGYPDDNTETLIITEAIIDATTLRQAQGRPHNFEVLAAYGTNGLTKEHKSAIEALPNLKEIIFFFDGDAAGKEGVNRLSSELKMHNEEMIISTVETPSDEDINSLYVKYGAECLMQLINERKPVNEISPETTSFSSIEILSNEEKEVQAQHALSPLDTANPNKITYETPSARYIIKGGICKPLDKMLVSLDVQHLETALKYRTRLDLYEERQTRKEAREAAEKLDLRSDLIETDLSKLTDLLEKHREREFENLKMSQSENGENTVSLAEQSKCKAFLSAPGLIERINELIGRSGITGEENNRLFLFVIATSHKMPDTLHALIQGSSGSGKTHLLSKIAELMPPERVVKFTRVTENSFYNYDHCCPG